MLILTHSGPGCKPKLACRLSVSSRRKKRKSGCILGATLRLSLAGLYDMGQAECRLDAGLSDAITSALVEAVLSSPELKNHPIFGALFFMARSSTPAGYFLHAQNARTKPSRVAMRAAWGARGASWEWDLLEILKAEKDCRLDISKKFVFAAVASQLIECKAEELSKFVDAMVNEYELLQSDGTWLWSDELVEDQKNYDRKIETLRNNGRNGGRPKKDDSQEPTGFQSVNSGNQTETKPKPVDFHQEPIGSDPKPDQKPDRCSAVQCSEVQCSEVIGGAGGAEVAVPDDGDTRTLSPIWDGQRFIRLTQVQYEQVCQWYLDQVGCNLTVEDVKWAMDAADRWLAAGESDRALKARGRPNHVDMLKDWPLERAIESRARRRKVVGNLADPDMKEPALSKDVVWADVASTVPKLRPDLVEGAFHGQPEVIHAIKSLGLKRMQEACAAGKLEALKVSFFQKMEAFVQ